MEYWLDYSEPVNVGALTSHPLKEGVTYRTATKRVRNGIPEFSFGELDLADLAKELEMEGPRITGRGVPELASVTLELVDLQSKLVAGLVAGFPVDPDLPDPVICEGLPEPR